MNSNSDDCDRDAARFTHAALQQQRNWAAIREVEVDASDFTVQLASNLFAPLSARTRTELAERPSGTLSEGSKPGEMSALCSTAALVHNAFDYWRDRRAGSMELAGGAASSRKEIELRFAARATPALPCERPSGAIADLVLNPSARPTVVAASFLEPYSRTDNRPSAGLLDRDTDWTGLQACRNLTLDLRANANRFRHLAVTHLLDLGQSWTRALGERGFRLLYLWYDGENRAAERIRDEINRFRMRTGGELDFVQRSWQEFFRETQKALRRDPDGDSHAGYLRYLGDRYFP